MFMYRLNCIHTYTTCHCSHHLHKYAHTHTHTHRYPGGSKKRWEQIAKFVSAKCHTSREQDDCIACAKKLHRNRVQVNATAATTASTDTPTNSDVWTLAQQKELENAIAEVDRSLPLKQRLVLISKKVTGKTAKDCLARWKKIKQAILKRKDKTEWTWLDATLWKEFYLQICIHYQI